jgi:hypothetical protein
LAFYMTTARNSNLHVQYFVDDVCKKIFDILDLAYKTQNSDYLTLTGISNSVIGRHSGLNLTGIASIVLRYWQNESSRTHYVLLGGVHDLIVLLNRLAQSAISVKSYTVEDYCSTLSEIGHMLIEFIVTVKEKHAVEMAKKDLKLVSEIAENMFNAIIQNQPSNSYESFNELSFLYASLLYYSNKSEDGFFLSLYSNSVKKLVETVDKVPEKDLDGRGYRNLYSYVKLFSAWLFHFSPKHQEIKMLKSFIRKKSFLSFLLDDSDYPDYFISDDRFIFGWNVWQSWGKDILEILRDYKIYSSFDKYLSQKR